MYLRPLLLLFYTCLAFLTQAQSVEIETMLDRFLDINVADNRVFAEGMTGFHLYDIESGRDVYAYNEARYFVPASNVKLLTFYLAHRVLGDRSPAIQYQRHPDRIELWPTGYPLLFHPSFVAYDELSPWLSRQSLPLVLNLATSDAPPRYGAGWSWDDYDYGYVYERSALPLYGNRLHLELAPPDGYGNARMYGVPPEIATNLIQDEGQRRLIHRQEGSNVFSLRENFTASARFPVQRALITDDGFTFRQLRAAFPHQNIRAGSTDRPAEVETLRLSLPDTLYRKLLQDSDNYLAEQLVLQCAAARYGKFDEATLFDYATDTLFAGLGAGELKYADGSGLSRYNLVKPRQFTLIVAALYREVGLRRLLDLLPAGGGSGTLKNRFDNRPETYIWAKTGSLSGVMCVSGLLRTKQGRWLAFSFLHNNLLGSTRDYYREMEGVLGGVYDAL